MRTGTPAGGGSGAVVQVPTRDGSMPAVRSVELVMFSGGSALVAGTTLKRMICRIGSETRRSDSGILRSTREVIVTRVSHRERSGRIVIQNYFLSGEPAEVYDDVPALGRAGYEAPAEGNG